MKKFTDFFSFVAALFKARWLFIFIVSFILSSIIKLRGIIFEKVDLDLSLAWVVVIFTFSSYPILKFIEWISNRKEIKLIDYGGLLWKPSRLRFRYPSPRCPFCKGKIVVSEVRKSMVVTMSIQDIENLDDKMFQYTYECPNHGVLSVPNKPVSYLQRLANAKLSNK